ncbi:TetR/AcrR family transcriptional regulator [Nocardioides sp.]|uniref:TetR/AcrR family transcriptional regulator n=1 Tax=Nocardioides sp. TaxID=35761 RepID=UPI0035119738
MIERIYADTGVADHAPTKRPNRRGEQTRQRLVAAATECFAEYGYSRTRVSDIVSRAGTAQGNFYRHFSSLDHLFLEVIRPGLEDLVAASTKRAGQDADLASLVDSNIACLRAYARRRHAVRLLREAATASANDGFERLWTRMRDDFVSRIHHWLDDLARGGAIVEGDHTLLAEMLVCLTEQFAYVHIALPSSTPRPERLVELGTALGQAWFGMLPRIASA